MRRQYPHSTSVNTLMVCAVDRFGMAEEIAACGGPAIYGDLMFALGLPIPIRSFRLVRPLAALILPVAVRLPFRWLSGNQTPDHNTLWRCYTRYRSLFAALFVESVKWAVTAQVLDLRLATWDLRPWTPDADFAVSILRRG